MATLKELRALAEKSHCSSFGTGYCWSLPNPHYTGHHRTKDEAARAALAKAKGEHASVAVASPRASA